MTNLIRTSSKCGCTDCCMTYELEGCANGVAHVQMSVTGPAGTQVSWINLETGLVSTTKPTGFATGTCQSNENSLAFSATSPTATAPFAVPKDNFTTFVTTGGAATDPITEMWKFDVATNAWYRVPLGVQSVTFTNTVTGHKIADVTVDGATTAINETVTTLDSVGMNAGALEVKYTGEDGTQVTKSTALLSTDAGNSLIIGTDGKIYQAATVLWDDDQVLTGDSTTNTTVTLTPEVVEDPDNPGVDQTNYTVKAETKIDGVTIIENGSKQLVAVNQKFAVTNTVRPTPTATGNTTNLNSIFKDATGITWAVDKDGNAISLGSPETVTVATKGDAAFPAAPLAGDEYLETVDGTAAGKVTGQWIFDGTDWVKRPSGAEYQTTSITPVVGDGTAFAGAQADAAANVADLMQLADGSFLELGKVVIPGHGFPVHSYLYLSQSTAGAIVTTMPTSGWIQRLGFVEDADTLWLDVEPAFESAAAVAGAKTTTSMVAQFGNGTAHVDAQANAAATVADVIKLSDGSLVNNEDKVTWTAHGFGLHKWYFLSATVAGGFTDTPPAAPNLAQRLFYVEDANTVKVNVQEAVAQASAGTPPTPTVASAMGPRGTEVQLDNIKLRVPTSGNVSLQIATASGTAVTEGQVEAVAGGGISTFNRQTTDTTTYTYLSAATNFAAAGNTHRYTFIDRTAGRAYVATLIVGNAYANNAIKIERLA